MKKLTSVADAIDALGGNKAVAQLFKCTLAAVHNWRRSGVLPAHSYPAISSEVGRLGFEAPIALWEFRRKKKQKATKKKAARTKARPAAKAVRIESLAEAAQ